MIIINFFALFITNCRDRFELNCFDLTKSLNVNDNKCNDCCNDCIQRWINKIFTSHVDFQFVIWISFSQIDQRDFHYDSIVLEQNKTCNKWMIKVVELLLSKKQSARYESNCQDVNSFWSRYHDFNSMCRFIVTDVINEKKSQRSRCVAWRKHAIHFSKNLLVIHEKK